MRDDETTRLRLGELSEEEIARRAADVLRGGGVALLPAEGVYGFHASVASAEAVNRVLELKGSAGRSGFIGLIARAEDAERWARLDEAARRLARKHWPGALTLVLDALENAPPILRSAEGTIALRCPGSSLLRRVVAQVGGWPVLSTSANVSGEPPATLFAGAPPGIADFGVDAGVLSGVPSTVVRVTPSDIRVLRAGAVELSGERGSS